MINRKLYPNLANEVDCIMKAWQWDNEDEALEFIANNIQEFRDTLVGVEFSNLFIDERMAA